MAGFSAPERWRLDLTDVNSYDPVAAYLCCWCSYYAYYDNALTYFREILGATNVRWFPPDETTGRPQGFMLRLEECSIVVFAGTSSLSQLYGEMRDCGFREAPNLPDTAFVGYPWGRHAAHVFDTYQSVIVAEMAVRKVLFCGHSLGGVIAATLCRAMQALPGPGSLPSQCYTFGAPKIGNRVMADLCKEMFHVINDDDPVPKLPPQGHILFVATLTAGKLNVGPNEPFTPHGRVVIVKPTGQTVVNEYGVGQVASIAPVAWDAAGEFRNVFLRINGKQPLRAITEFLDRYIPYHECGYYLGKLETNLPLRLHPEVFVGDVGKAVEEKLEVLSTIDLQPQRIIPPAFPTPAASTAVRPLKRRKRH